MFVLDNFPPHKSSLTMKIMQDKKCKVLFLPSHSPEFSPVENMFSLLKKKIRNEEFKNKEYLATVV